MTYGITLDTRYVVTEPNGITFPYRDADKADAHVATYGGTITIDTFAMDIA